VSDIREDRVALDQIAKLDLLEGVPTGATGTPGHKALEEHFASKPPAADSDMSRLEFDTDGFIDQRSIFERTASNRNTYPRFEGLDSTRYGPDFSGTRDVTDLGLCLLTSADWRVLRAARLRALLDSPHAFASSYAHESVWGESEWRRMFIASTWVVASDAEKVIGLARSVRRRKPPATLHLESIWTAPTHRRCGVFRALLHALAVRARQTAVTDLLLWVLEDNHAAQRAYEALGFEPTGERHFLRAFGRFELRLKLGIRGAPPSPPQTRRPFDHRSAKLGQEPGVQLKEVHSLPSAANIVDTAGESLPVVEVLPPGVEEVHTELSRDGV
jgi:ribosomal protein S18 acetylase RimI-like enzyme